MKIEMQVDLLQPWSTFVMKTQLPPDILEKMLRITDEIVEDSAIKSDSLSLSEGVLEYQFQIGEERLEGTNLMDFFGAVCKNYIIQAFCQSQPFNKDFWIKEQYMVKLTSIWVNSQKDNEYLPDHTHMPHSEHKLFPGRAISAVMYLKIPEYLPRPLRAVADSYEDEKQKNVTYMKREENYNVKKDGAIIFTNNTSQDQIWAYPSLEISPQVGDFLIFLASQHHQVYPFRTPDGTGERRSVSFNAVFSSEKEQENEKDETKKKYVDGNLR
jgi:hypothetical protein